MKKALAVLSVLTVLLGSAFATGSKESAAAQEKAPTELVIWSAAQEKEAKALVAKFNVIHPEIKVNIIRAGAGELNTRLNAEQPKPSGDILLGASQEILDGSYNYFRAYKSVNDSKLDKNLRDRADVPKYYSYSMPIQCFMVNTDLLKPEEYPKTWKDLADPKYKGKIIMGNPALSGGAYAQLYMIYKLYGESILPALAKNCTFTPNSTTVGESVARGEYAIGVTAEYNVSKFMVSGSHVTYVYPEDGTGLRFDGSAIINNGPNPKAAELFMDFLTTEDAYRTIRETQGRRVVMDNIPDPDFLPSLKNIKFFDYNAVEAQKLRKDLTDRFSEMML
ncbi:extracellular solute-binding protein [Treponema parvum]|uniref:Extracellular solute-binding protein n=1 Tax=Treponema parvum TaxID=138851 RepID=A0A975IDG3_9SPIR|nr:extracellular solute-binding protein [Treponema parvum]QTQ12762.1 extracellular solute-binding protein [Treponema parvum]